MGRPLRDVCHLQQTIECAERLIPLIAVNGPEKNGVKQHMGLPPHTALFNSSTPVEGKRYVETIWDTDVQHQRVHACISKPKDISTKRKRAKTRRILSTLYKFVATAFREPALENTYTLL